MKGWISKTVRAADRPNLPPLSKSSLSPSYSCGKSRDNRHPPAKQNNNNFQSLLYFPILCIYCRSLTVTVTWTAYHRFRFHFKRRLPSYTTVEDDEVIESEDSMAPLVGNGHGHVANGNPVKPPSRQSTAKDEPSYLVAVTALGKLGLIMAYFYLCDRYVSMEWIIECHTVSHD